MNVGTDVIKIRSVKKHIRAHLAVLDPVAYCYENVDMILGQYKYHPICHLKYVAAKDNCSPFAVHLSIGWVPSYLLPSSSKLVSAYFKTNAEQILKWLELCYDMENYATLRQVGQLSAADARVHEDFGNIKTKVHNGKR